MIPESMGAPLAPNAWMPLIEDTIPAEDKIPAFANWITSYFEHGNLSTRDLNVLSTVVPSNKRVPVIYEFNDEETTEIITEIGTTMDLALLAESFVPLFQQQYRKAVFNATTRAFWKDMEVVAVTGNSTSNLSIAAFWTFQMDTEAQGGTLVQFKLLPGPNHLVSSKICHLKCWNTHCFVFRLIGTFQNSLWKLSRKEYFVDLLELYSNPLMGI